MHLQKEKKCAVREKLGPAIDRRGRREARREVHAVRCGCCSRGELLHGGAVEDL